MVNEVLYCLHVGLYHGLNRPSAPNVYLESQHLVILISGNIATGMKQPIVWNYTGCAIICHSYQQIYSVRQQNETSNSKQI